jgi:uncharacterized protein (UPF0210 family)
MKMTTPMNIRTITVGARESDVPRAARAAHMARKQLESAGYVVQTTRLALTTSGFNECADFATVAQGAEALALEAGFDYVSLGRVEPERLASVPEALAATENVFVSARIAGRDGGLDPAAISGAAAVIRALAQHTPQGFGNLRFAAAACVAPGSPFFPASYHSAGEPWLAIGPEAAALAVAATQPSAEPGTPAQRLTVLIEQHDAAIRTALATFEKETEVYLAGCDWSLAPHPDPACSIGAAIEALSGVPFGAWGTLAAVRQLTESIRQARVIQIGFSGVMLPVLEDAVLAQRNTEGRFSLRDVLAFSAVCGTGLDTIPLAGDLTPQQIAAILAEVAALAGMYRKPLTARLMPIPGLQAGNMTAFDFPYFVNTRVLAYQG